MLQQLLPLKTNLCFVYIQIKLLLKKMAYLLRQACDTKSAVILYCQSTARYSIAGHN